MLSNISRSRIHSIIFMILSACVNDDSKNTIINCSDMDFHSIHETYYGKVPKFEKKQFIFVNNYTDSCFSNIDLILLVKNHLDTLDAIDIETITIVSSKEGFDYPYFTEMDFSKINLNIVARFYIENKDIVEYYKVKQIGNVRKFQKKKLK